MVKRGYEVYVFEALHEIGGVLKYGIPEFRLPNRIVDVEIENLRRMGVHFQTDTIVGKTISIDELKEHGFKGIFVGSGAGLPNFMGIEGENSINILSSNEYLTRVNLMDAANPETDTPIIIGKKVLVIGGGNTAMDSCRTAKRLGADVTLVYRRSEAEMPARLEEVKHAKEEGVHFLTLHNPQSYKADEKGRGLAAGVGEAHRPRPEVPQPEPGEAMEDRSSGEAAPEVPFEEKHADYARAAAGDEAAVEALRRVLPSRFFEAPAGVPARWPGLIGVLGLRESFTSTAEDRAAFARAAGEGVSESPQGTLGGGGSDFRPHPCYSWQHHKKGRSK